MKSTTLLFALATTFVAPLGSSEDFVTVDGNEIHYEIKGSGTPWIVLVTGNGLGLNSLDPIFDDLSEVNVALVPVGSETGRNVSDIARERIRRRTTRPDERG